MDVHGGGVGQKRSEKHVRNIWTRVGQIRRFVYVAPKSKHLGTINPWMPKFFNLSLGNHLRLGLEVL